ncbi:MAG: methylated-DNA--[protein]-cysteine S-methyltransferase [Candidatus Scalindua sp.]|jgi:methylated-DNA-[protein]-cysteine S-methyltransferase|nr:methylated-DNA--[protein]-cysteine S-methyltransferase [Candidatus Scalindua sp.]MBT5304361.1 methylated-DNA--[protein]-cysteine S-methyltransferase [Candidatus Scalindua sp.]MBT6051816.1 methylated-DNA--[protein]-cysteine S-methyltransferase [Candidatus Scalindua sp.]MBT6228161.1 methylated-DNA--[protein]-cysteine S-methyltransferase [Candidatus Scalindua sp.]MBT6562928.1 methylated-DNA--[protein]-cysteine S-methyltransferase [Candidatus Scalindua sp.]
MNQINIKYYKTKIGELILGSFDGRLCLLDYRYRRMRVTVDNRIKKGLGADFVEKNDEVLSKVRAQLDEYLNGDRTSFDIPVLMVGTDFQKSVWEALMKIPYGKTASYLDIAKFINKEKAVRAVANANGANSMSLIIPCHRIIGSNGELVGYGGGVPVKKRLLKFEQNNSYLSDNEKYSFIGSKNIKYDGVFFTAVKTTGIYCKPSCSARKPNRENVIFYDTKNDATENGYRPCKACKP